MRSRLVRTIVPVLILAACDTPTGPSLREVLLQRAQWQAQGLADYSYVWEQDGFFNTLEGRPIRLEVRGGVIQSAVFVATGDTVPGSPTGLPTIDAMFDRAITALNDHKLTAIVFDGQYHYLARMDLAGPPDASGSFLASQLAPAP